LLDMAGKIVPMKKVSIVLVGVVLMALAGCAPSTSPSASAPDLPPIDGAGIRQVLSDLTQPAVVNVWASWCMPCRSEAPLIAKAHAERTDVAFIGVDVEDNQTAAKDFIDEFGLDFDQYFDSNRAVPAELGGFGTPITYFVAPGGEVIQIHSGVLDERTLALMLDELTG
jgi:cytochrome c biogenesis protein CcmG/thiol:disulfide interchange protein DsbE